MVIITDEVLRNAVALDVAAQRCPDDKNLLEFAPPASAQLELSMPVIAPRHPPDALKFNQQTFAEFDTYFRDMYPVDGRGWVLAGGVVLRALKYTRGSGILEHLATTYVDIDVFPVGIAAAEGNAAIQTFIDRTEPIRVLRTGGAVTVFYMSGLRIQFITRRYQNIAAILHGFDIGVCSLAWDGSRVLMTQLASLCLQAKLFPLIPNRTRARFQIRLHKYISHHKYAIALLNANIDKVHDMMAELHGTIEFPGIYFNVNYVQENTFIANRIVLHSWYRDTAASETYGGIDDYDSAVDYNIRHLVRTGMIGVWIQSKNGMLMPLGEADISEAVRQALCTKKSLRGKLSYIPDGISPDLLYRQHYLANRGQSTDAIDDAIDTQLVPAIVDWLATRIEGCIQPNPKWRKEDEATRSELTPAEVEEWYGKLYEK